MITLSFLCINEFCWNSSNISTNNNLKNDSELLIKLKASDYSPNFTNTGGDFNISLHQSLINTSSVEFTNLDTFNNLIEPSPNLNGYTTSLVNISIENIYAPNYTLIIEDDLFEGTTDVSAIYVTSFTVGSSCYLDNASFNVFTASGAPLVDVYLFNSTWSQSNSRNEPNVASSQIIASFSSPPDGWNKINLTKTLLNKTKTDNNTWFIGLRESSALASFTWRYVSDSTNGDNSLAYYLGGFILQNYDFDCTVDISPLNSQPYPSDIGLKINNSNVEDVSQGSGNWFSTSSYFSSTDELEFRLTADWGNVSCNVTKVQINYTKTDLKASSEFKIAGSGEVANWNVTRSGGLNYFDPRFNNYQINFTIPESWNNTNIRVFNGESDERTSTITKRLLGNNYREINVPNAGNGTFWFLNTSSSNLLNSVDSYIGLSSTNTFNSTSIAHFNATFSKEISDGTINLNVYSPAMLNDELNYSVNIQSFTAGSEISLTDWDISNNVTQYGVFRIQVYWNNNTDTGFRETNITILGETTLTILNPTGPSAYDEDEILDILVEYKDHVKNTGINGADVRYSINDTELGNLIENPNGTYTIAINLSNPNFGSDYGNVDITILANKTNYINLTRVLTIERKILTQISPPNPPSLIEVIRGNSIFFTFNYSDKLGNPIDTYDEFINATPLQNFGWSIVNDGAGNYTLEMNTSQVVVVATPYTLNFSIYTFGNQLQEVSFSILLTLIQTSVEIESWNSNVDFARSTLINASIDFYFNDTTNNQAITGLSNADIIVKNFATGTHWAPGFTLFNRPGPGYYTLNISMVAAESGFYTLNISISKFPNYNWSRIQVAFYLRGNYTQFHLISVSDPGGQLTQQGAYNFTIFEGSDINLEFNVTDLEYMDTIVLGDAEIYSIWSENLLTGDNVTLLNNVYFRIQTGTHVGSVTTSNAALTPGNYFIHIALTKSNYELAFYTFNLTVIPKFPVMLNISKPDVVDAGDSFSIVVKTKYFNGTDWNILEGAYVRITPYFDGVAGTPTSFIATNSTGEVLFTINSRSDVSNLTLSIELQGTYHSLDGTLEIPITITKRGSQDLPFWIYPIIILAVSVSAGIIIKKRSTNKKRKVEDLLPAEKQKDWTFFGVPQDKELIFISYATKDSDLFQIPRITEILKHYPEIDDVLYWESDMLDDIYGYMDDNLKRCKIVLLFCTKSSSYSEAVKMEWRSALKLGKKILPVFIEEEYIPTLLTTKLGIQFNKEDPYGSIEKIYQLILKKLEISSIREYCKFLVPSEIQEEDFEEFVSTTNNKECFIESELKTNVIADKIIPILRANNFYIIGYKPMLKKKKKSQQPIEFDLKVIKCFAEDKNDNKKIGLSITIQKKTTVTSEMMVKFYGEREWVLTEISSDLSNKLLDLKNTNQLIKEYSAQLEKAFENIPEGDTFFRKIIGPDYKKLKSLVSQYLNHEIEKTFFISEGIQIIGKEFLTKLIKTLIFGEDL
jgi:hypothetical protein